MRERSQIPRAEAASVEVVWTAHETRKANEPMTGTQTYSMARLEVSKDVYLEIRSKLIDANYKHHLGQDREHGERIDMHGIALVLPKLTHSHPSKCVNWNVECHCREVMNEHKGDIFGGTSDNVAQSVPDMLIVEKGQLSLDTIKRIEDFLAQKNGGKIAIVEQEVLPTTLAYIGDRIEEIEGVSRHKSKRGVAAAVELVTLQKIRGLLHGEGPE